MDWDSSSVKTLRCRMGWSQSDLARRLQIDCENIKSWEAGTASPDDNVSQMLSLLFQQAEVTALDMINQVQAEVIMDQKHLESVLVEEIHSLVENSDSSN